MAIQPDPVGAFTSTFGTADSSNRDWQRLDLQKRAQDEAAIQRAREQKANDFKMMMMSLSRQDSLKQQDIANNMQSYQLQTGRYAANVQGYRAEYGSSRSQANMLDFGPPGSTTPGVPSADGGQRERPDLMDLPMGDPMGKTTAYGYAGDSTPDRNSSAGIGAWVPDAEAARIRQGQDSPYKLRPGDLAVSPDVEEKMRQQGIKPGEQVTIQYGNGKSHTGRWMDRTADVYNGRQVTGRFDLYSPAGVPKDDGSPIVGFSKAGAAPTPQPVAAPAVPPPVAAQPPDLSVSTTGQYGFPSTPSIYNDALTGTLPQAAPAAPPEVPAPVTAQRPINEFVGVPAIPEFGSANIETAGRRQLADMERVAKESQVGMDQARREQANALIMLRNRALPAHRRPEWQDYLMKQQAVESDLSSKVAEAKVEAAQKKAELKVTTDLQGKLNTLTGLNNVLPRDDRQTIINEASNPETTSLAENKIKTLTEYDTFRRINGLKHMSNGYQTAEQVALAAREMQSPAAIKAQRDAELMVAYQKELKDSPDMSTKQKEEIDSAIAKLAPSATLAKLNEARMAAALNADIKPPPKDEVPGQAAPAAPATPVKPATIDRSTGRDITKSEADKLREADLSQGNSYWGENANYVAQQVMMDGGKDKDGNVVPPMNIASLEAIVKGDQPVTESDMSSEGFLMERKGKSFADHQVEEHLKGWKPSPGNPAKWGRRTQPTPQDFLVAAAKERLQKLKAEAGSSTPPISAETKAATNAVRVRNGLPPLP